VFDVSSALTAVGGVGLLTFGQQTIKYIRDERRKKIENAREDSRAPILERSQWLSLADQATMIQQRTIKALEDQLQQVQLELSTLRAENTELRAQDKIKTAQIRELYATIGQLEAESRQRPPGRRQATPPP
jgi:CRP-like cAMP-binding protein